MDPNTDNTAAWLGAGVDSASSPTAANSSTLATTISQPLFSIAPKTVADGYHYISILEYSNASGTQTWTSGRAEALILC